MTRRQYLKLGLAAGVVVLLSACAAPLPVTTPTAQDEQFIRSGRFALAVDNADGSRDAVQGGFQWQENPQRLQLDLTNPMGTVLARVEASATGAILRYPNGQTEYATSPDALVEQLFGYAIPVEGMRDWLRGQTGSRPTTDLALQQQQPSYFVQDGWRVRLQRYDALGPKLLQMHRHQAQQNLSVRIVVDY